MQRIVFFLSAFSVLILSGCAASTKQTDEILATRTHGLPRSALVWDVPFIEQDAGHCGPASLAMVMGWSGQSVDVKELAAQVYHPAKVGTLQTDLISAARRQGMMAVPLTNMQNLLREVAAGHPVIVFENLALPVVPRWHYALVFGYDLDREHVVMHSGPEAYKEWDIRKFERSWKLGDYWGLVVLPPSELAVTVGEVEHVAAAAGLEQATRPNEAEMAYKKILGRWPKSLGALVGLGNLEFNKKRYAKAEAYLIQATRHHPKSEIAKNNLSVAQAAKKTSLAR